MGKKLNNPLASRGAYIGAGVGLGLVLLIITGLYFTLGVGLQSVILTRDSFDTPTEFAIEFHQETGLTDISLDFTFTEQVQMYGVCVPNTGTSGKAAADYCRSLGHKDRGCGWDTEVACSCTVNQQGCNGVRSLPINSPLVFTVAGQKVYEHPDYSGITLNQNNANLANVILDYCRDVFEDVAEDSFTKNKDCNVPVTITGGPAAGRVVLSGVVGADIRNIDVILPNHCDNGIQDVDEVATDCGGSCGACDQGQLECSAEEKAAGTCFEPPEDITIGDDFAISIPLALSIVLLVIIVGFIAGWLIERSTKK